MAGLIGDLIWWSLSYALAAAINRSPKAFAKGCAAFVATMVLWWIVVQLFPISQ